MTGSPSSSEPGATSVVLDSVLTCPHCGAREKLEMPTDACLYVHECTGCGAPLKPKAGDCCVFCSYGTVPCPPVQLDRGPCAAPDGAG